MVKTGIVYHEDYLKHDTGDHVENKRRLIASVDLLNEYKVFEHPNIVKISPIPAPIEEVQRVHKDYYIDRVNQKCLSGGGWLDA
ncbi:MAG: histone deacetylase, partial [Candidatus Hodarchaeota archaeon]